MVSTEKRLDQVNLPTQVATSDLPATHRQMATTGKRMSQQDEILPINMRIVPMY